MKRLLTSPYTPMLLIGIVVSSTLLFPVSSAFARLSIWAYPETPQEQRERSQDLGEQLGALDETREKLLVTRTEIEERLVALLDRLQLAEIALRAQRAPLDRALEKYRQAQEIALSDYMIDPEIQRQEYVLLKNETAASIKAHQERVDQINLQVAQTTERLSSVRLDMNTILHQIDNLWIRQDTINRIVFLQSVND